jgi:hypothetical protein
MPDNHRAKADALLKRAGYGGGKSPLDTTRTSTGPVERADPMERARGGAIPGAAPEARARGGRTGKGHKTNVNVIVAPQGGGGPHPGMMPPPMPVRPPIGGVPPGAAAG